MPGAKPEVTYTRQVSLSPAMCVPSNIIAYLKLNLEIERVIEFFLEFLAVERLERTELEEEAILRSIG